MTAILGNSYGLAQSFKAPKKFGILTDVGIHIFPGEDFVFTGCNAPQTKTAILIGGGRFKERALFPPARLRNQNDGCGAGIFLIV
jgi:hypothetical protein